MTEKEQIAFYIEKFIDLQRLKAATDYQKELDYQIKTLQGILAEIGVSTENYIM